MQAALLRFRPIMMTTLAALFGALPLALGTRHRLGAAQPARHHHRRRPAAEPVADALHHAGDLPDMERLRARLAPCAAGAAPGPAARRRSRPMNFSCPFIRRPIGTTLLAVGLFLVGAVAYASCRSPACRAWNFPTINVTASRPGADPNIMAATVAAPLERRLGEIAGVTEITSVSSLGSIAHHRTVRPRAAASKARHAMCRPRSTPRSATCRATCRAADIPEGQSRGGADPDPGAHLQDHAAECDL